jgi:hypothetical protein
MRRAITEATLSAVLLAAPVAVLAAGGHGGGMGGIGGGMAGIRQAPAIRANQMAAPTTHSTGQPNQSCQAGANYPANTPGNSYNAPGSAFDPNGVADSKYAGTQPQNSKNPNSVSQYDVACTHQK